MKSTFVWIVIIILLAGGAWYWMSSKSPSTTAGLNGSPNQTNTGQPTVAPVATIANDATLGDHLVAANGMTLYMYTKDTSGVSKCTGTCATNWPPYAPVAGEPIINGSGIGGNLATLRRDDGTDQVTYNGAPLYFYIKDTKAGDTTGQNVGTVWFVVKP